MSDYAVFDGEHVDVTVLTTHEGARRLETQHESHPWVDVVATDTAAHGDGVDLKLAVALLKERYGINYLLCEGGPLLYTGMVMDELIDEKFLTVSPMEVGLHGINGLRPTILSGVGFGREDAVRWHWLSCRKVDDFQFHRFRRKFTSIC
jgi:riboflavin biosynthesis pyrimidine reductase